MTNKRNNVLVDHDGLFGDAPGAALVTVTVDGRTLQMPRALLLTLTTFAGNRADDLKASYRDDPEGRAWLVRFERHCREIAEFARS